jgi:hypothetical protein
MCDVLLVLRNLLSVGAHWIAAVAVLLGAGRIVLVRACRPSVNEAPVALTLWVGLAVVLAASYVLHLFVPLHSTIVAVLLLAALGSGVWHVARSEWSQRTPLRSVIRRRLVLIVPLVVAGSLLFIATARGVVADVANYDSYLYHLQIIEYLSSERVVVGLANLHTRLGFHSSIFNVASLFENGTWGGNGFRFANGFIVVLAVIEWGSRARRLAKGLLPVGSIPVLLGVPPLIAIGLSDPQSWIAPPGPDLCAALVAIVALGYLIDLLFDPTVIHMLGALVLCGLSATFRLVNVVLFVVAIIVAIAVLRGGDLGLAKRASLRLASPALFLLFAFCVHSTVVTGYPIFPTPVQVSPFHWAVPPALIKNDLRWIESWAKKPGVTPDEVLGSWSWVGEWWTRTSGEYTVFIVILAMSCAVLLVGARMGWARYTNRALCACAIAVLPVAVWFVQAPAPRFGLGQLAGAAVSPLFFLRLDTTAGGVAADRNVKRLVGAAALLSAALLVGDTLGSARFFGRLDAAPRPLVTFPLTEVEVVDGTTILTPEVGDQCGRVKWCTPYPTDELQGGRWLGWLVISRADPSDSAGSLLRSGPSVSPTDGALLALLPRRGPR